MIFIFISYTDNRKLLPSLRLRVKPAMTATRNPMRFRVKRGMTGLVNVFNFEYIYLLNSTISVGRIRLASISKTKTLIQNFFLRSFKIKRSSQKIN